MSTPVSRRWVFAGLSAVLASSAAANPPSTSLRPKLRTPAARVNAVPSADALIDAAKLRGKIGFAVAEASSGKALESRNGNTALPPASVAKAVTALYALSVLGGGHRFTTKVVATGGVSGGVVQGDLVLMGGADPTLDSNHLAALASQLKASGIREVRGRFLIYDGALPREDRIDPDQPDHVGYNPGIAGIALNFNRVHFEWRRGSGGYQIAMDARTTKLRPDVRMARMKLVARDAPVYTYSKSRTQEDWTVARSALGGNGSRWLPVRLPGLYAGDVFRTLARSNGIVLPKAALSRSAPGGTLVASHASAPLQTILRDMLKFSNNLTAEMVGMAASRARKPAVSSLRGSAGEMNTWAKSALGMSKIRLVDHSGLGDDSRMSAQEMCAALSRIEGQGFGAMLKPFVLRDAKGRPQKAHPVKVVAKTGTLNFVSSLAGYVTAPNGRKLAFAIFTVDEQTRSKISRANRERPQGARSWNRRAKGLQQALIERWVGLYSG